MKVLLRAKHWQLFLAIFGILIILEILVFILAFAGVSGLWIILLFAVMMFCCMGTYLGWMYTIATHFNKRLPDNAGMNLKRFRFFFFVPIIYLFAVYFWIFADGDMPPVGLIIPLHLFSMFCMGYNLYFCSKTLKAVELQREVTFGDYMGEFFMLWFFPIGIWFIQPRVNKLFAEDNNVEINY